MHTQHNRKQEAAEDIFFGQLVIIWARWFVIAAGLIYALWVSTTTTQLITTVLLFMVIIGVNFFVHGRYLMEKPINQVLLLGLSFIDLFMVTVIVFMGSEGTNVIDNSLFIFYYPLLVAFAFVFPQRLTAVYTVLTLLAYGVICFTTSPQLFTDSAVLETLVMRMITLASVGGLATYYWRIQRQRRRAFSKTFQSVS